MCGIVGLVGNLHSSDFLLLRHLLFMDTTRGVHSTGVFNVDLNDNLHVEKTVGSPGNLYETDQSHIWDWEGKVRSKAPTSKVMVGHNRYATIGHINTENAHPFTEGSWVGVHNGSLDSYHHLTKEKYDVDSRCMIAGFNEKGFKHTWESMSGAAAVVAWDQAENKLYIARNDERPLYFATFRNNSAMIIASESWMIEALEEKQGVSSVHKLSDVDKLKKNYMFTLCPTSIHFGKFESESLKDNTGWYRNYPGVSKRVMGKSSSTGGTSNVVGGTSLIEREFKKNNSRGWSDGTQSWKMSELCRNTELSSLRLMLSDMSSINPYTTIPTNKHRCIKFTVSNGVFENTPVFVYLDDLKLWKDWYENKDILTNAFSSDKRFEFRHKPRIVVSNTKDQRPLIAIHMSITGLKKVEPPKHVACSCCNEDYKKEELEMINDMQVCKPCVDHYGQWLGGYH